MGDSAKNVPIALVAIVLLGLSGLLFANLMGAVDIGRWGRGLAGARSPEEDPARLWVRAQAYYLRNNTTWAAATARRVTYLDPRHKPARKLLAAIYLREKNYPAALEQSRESVRLDPTDMTALIGYGIALEGLGKKDQARAAFEKVLKSPFSTSRMRDEVTVRLAELDPSSAGRKSSGPYAGLDPAAAALFADIPSPSPSPSARPRPFPTSSPSPLSLTPLFRPTPSAPVLPEIPDPVVR